MRKTVIACVEEHARTMPEKTAVIDHGRRTGYGELYRYVCGYRSWLLEHGVRKGDIVVLKADQNVEYAVIYLSIHSIGAVAASLEKHIPAESMKAVIAQLHADHVLTDDAGAGEMPPAHIIARGDVLKTAREYANAAETAESGFSGPNLADSADILFTTGTTGASKGAELTHRTLAATAENLICGCGYRPDTVILVPGPLNHANAIRKLFTTFVNGSTICLLDGMMNMKAFFRALDEETGHLACCLPPSAIRTIFQLTREKLGEYADKIDFIESATSPLPESDKEKLCKLLPKTRLYNNYGSSESASVCMYDYNANPGKAGCIGKPMPNAEILIVDENRKPMESSADHIGLIACRGDINMKGYVNDPELTAEVLQDNILYTSDMGYMDDDGYVYIVGRKDDVINVGGLKVAPTEVEEAALAFDGVEDCICIGVDDKISGKALKLLLVMREGTDLSPRDMKSFLSARLESHKVPRFYEAVDHVQRTYNGKPDRKAYL